MSIPEDKLLEELIINYETNEKQLLLQTNKTINNNYNLKLKFRQFIDYCEDSLDVFEDASSSNNSNNSNSNSNSNNQLNNKNIVSFREKVSKMK